MTHTMMPSRADPDLPSWFLSLFASTIRCQMNRYTKKHTTQNHVALICKGRKLLAIGQNRVASRLSGCGCQDRMIHAEVDAIKTLGDTSKLRGATLFVVRIMMGGHLGPSAPCKTCQPLLAKCQRDYGLRAIQHS
jgi:hypothetical protein